MGLCGILDASVPFDRRMEKAEPLALLSVIHERGITGRALSPSTNRAPRRLRTGRGAFEGPRPRAKIHLVEVTREFRRVRSTIASFLRRDRTADWRWDKKRFPVDSRRDCVVAFFPKCAVFPLRVFLERVSFMSNVNNEMTWFSSTLIYCRMEINIGKNGRSLFNQIFNGSISYLKLLSCK